MDSQQPGDTAGNHLLNTTVRTLSWSGVTVTAALKDSTDKRPRTILHHVDGFVEAGECCAIMGPSGCGKTTLLNVLARRPLSAAATVEGTVAVNGVQASDDAFRHVTSFVEDTDNFIASLTVRETLEFASKLAGIPPRDSRARIDALLTSFGLSAQASTPISKGLSHGQKRRLAVARQLVTGPKILFLDEPTSGLDSAASFHIVRHLRDLARLYGLVVLCSIHQPSTSTVYLFDKLMLLSAGKLHYFGPVNRTIEHYESVGVSIPPRANPAEFLLELVNVDFSEDKAAASQHMAELHSLWQNSAAAQRVRISHSAAEHEARTKHDAKTWIIVTANQPSISMAWKLLTLVHRGFLKAYRDAMAYRFRLFMYIGLAVLMGTIWLRLDRNQDSIQLLINALIVACGFMAFMAVTYVPAFIEDYQQYIHEHRNGLCGATRFCLSNFAVGTPHLFLFSLAFSVVFYWLANCQPSAPRFFAWVMWLFLDLLAAEAVAVLAVSIVPDVVAAIVLMALINVLMFATAGTLVPVDRLNAFYKYALYYWNFQTYIFQGMMASQFDGQTYDCGSDCHCRYRPMPSDNCHIEGKMVLDQYGVKARDQGRNVGIVIAIILGYRLAAWAVLKFKH